MNVLMAFVQTGPDEIASTTHGVMNSPLFALHLFSRTMSVTPWKLIGYIGTFMFGGRWLVQFFASRRAQRPVIPRLFWYMSILGSLMTLSYFIFGKNDSVGILSNIFPSFTAIYSLILDIRHHGWNGDRAAR